MLRVVALLLPVLLFLGPFGVVAQPSSVTQVRLIQQRWKTEPAKVKKPYQTWQSVQEYNESIQMLNAILKKHKSDANLPLDQLVTKVGLSLSGKPIRYGMTYLNKVEQPVFYLTHFDAFSLVDNTIALALTVKYGPQSLDGFMGWLEKVRYRDGQCRGFASRLHYFSDWVYDTERRGLLTDMTKLWGGVPDKSLVCKVTECQQPSAQEDSLVTAMRPVEAEISKRETYFLPFPVAKSHLDSLKTGDIIGFTSFRHGLDVINAGIVIRKEDGPYILFAKQEIQKVTISFAPIGNILFDKNKLYSGMKIARLKPNGRL